MKAGNIEVVFVDTVVVDTNVFSYISEDSEYAERYSLYLEDKVQLLSFQTVGELYLGAYKKNWGDKKLQQLESEIESYQGIIYPDYKTAEIWANIKVKTTKSGKELKDPDAWVAATAMRLECPLVTHNGDFKMVEKCLGLHVIKIDNNGNNNQTPLL